MLHESIQKFPNSPLVYIAVSEDLLSRENDLEKSITILRKATQTAPGIYASLKGKLLTPENTLDKAITILQAMIILREGIESAPEPDIYIELNQALLSESKTEEFEDTIAALREDFKTRNHLSNFCKIVENYLQDTDLSTFVEKYYSEIAESGYNREIDALVNNLDQHGHIELALNLLESIKTQ